MSALIYEYTHFVTIPSHPVVVTDGISLVTPRGVVFHPVTATVESGSAVAVVGAAGSGKSAFLLALTGRLRGLTGGLRVEGIDALRHPRQVRKITSTARIDDLIAPEASLSLEDCVTERTLADGANARARLANYLHTALLLGLDEPRSTLFGSLTPADQIRASLALATIKPASLVVLDDLDAETTLAEQTTLWGDLLKLADDGVTVVASTAERTTVPDGVQIIELGPRHA